MRLTALQFKLIALAQQKVPPWDYEDEFRTQDLSIRAREEILTIYLCHILGTQLFDRDERRWK